jgi:hypothetical protein
MQTANPFRAAMGMEFIEDVFRKPQWRTQLTVVINVGLA